MAPPAARPTVPVSARLVPLALLLLAAHPARGETGLLRDVVFADYTPLSSNLELARREPLALLAAHNLMRRYPVDPERVYVGGFSGGARVAMRLALGYPDLFRGAILNAGSDPIGGAEIPLPPRELFMRFQSSTRIVYVTGERDDPHVSDDSVSMQS